MHDIRVDPQFRGFEQGSRFTVEAWCYAADGTEEGYYAFEGKLAISLRRERSVVNILVTDDQVSVGNPCLEATTHRGIDFGCMVTNWTGLRLR
jgi:hypothetical protein